MNLVELQKAVQSLPRSGDFRLFGRSAMHRAVLMPLMAELGVHPFRVDDISRAMGLTRGRVYAVRWDITAGEVGFKQPVISSLLLFHLWRRRDAVSEVRVLTDGGNINTCLAMSCIASRLGMLAEYYISRYFPADMRQYMMKQGHSCLKLIEAPPAQMGIEREFYSYLLNMMRNPVYRRTHLCTWHAKYSGIATAWLGEAFADTWSVMPDDIVMGLGSGSTLVGYAIPLKARFGMRPRIIVAEHNKSRLICNAQSAESLPSRDGQLSEYSQGFRLPPKSIPHMVLGPHYDDINPLLTKDVLNQIDAVIRYSDADWQNTSHACQVAGLSIGNSSAANLAVARFLANQGRTVFTFLYEPFRELYIAHNNDK